MRLYYTVLGQVMTAGCGYNLLLSAEVDSVRSAQLLRCPPGWDSSPGSSPGLKTKAVRNDNLKRGFIGAFRRKSAFISGYKIAKHVPVAMVGSAHPT